MDEKKIFAKNLNYYMERKGKTQTDLINELGINKSTISTWCNGVKMPRMGTIQTLADYFGIMKSDLIEDKPTAAAGTKKGDAPTTIEVAEALRQFFLSTKGREPTKEELDLLRSFTETYIKGM